MTAAALGGSAAAASPEARNVRSVLRLARVALGLAAIVLARSAAARSGASDALTVGIVFGVALLALGIAAGERLGRPPASSVALGLAGGGVLIVLALVGHAGRIGPSLTPAGAFGPWAAVTILVATAEELVLRGALFRLVQREAGVMAAVVVTTLAFALMHVPLYGWHVVPLDLGVGLWLGGLRLLGRGVAAPAVAHVVADLATWWL